MAKVAMRLAQAPWAPEGDLEDHLELRLHLDAQARPDLSAFEAAPEPWTATRCQPGHPPRTTRLTRVDGTWALCGPVGDNEPLWTVIGDMFRPGEIIHLRQPDGTTLLFRVVSVEEG